MSCDSEETCESPLGAVPGDVVFVGVLSPKVVWGAALGRKYVEMGAGPVYLMWNGMRCGIQTGMGVSDADSSIDEAVAAIVTGNRNDGELCSVQQPEVLTKWWWYLLRDDEVLSRADLNVTDVTFTECDRPWKRVT